MVSQNVIYLFNTIQCMLVILWPFFIYVFSRRLHPESLYIFATESQYSSKVLIGYHFSFMSNGNAFDSLSLILRNTMALYRSTRIYDLSDKSCISCSKYASSYILSTKTLRLTVSLQYL